MTQKYEDFNGVEYISNYDGDTVKISIPGIAPIFGEKISVRVRGIDTPEKYGKKPCERELASSAQQFVESQLNTSNVINLVEPDREKYFRILANISYDEQDLSALLLNNYLAVQYDGGTKPNTDWCALQQQFHTTPWYKNQISGDLEPEDF